MILVAAKVSRHLAGRNFTVLPVDSVLMLGHVAPRAHVSIWISAIIVLAQSSFPVGVLQRVVRMLESLVPEQTWLPTLQRCPALCSPVICTVGCEALSENSASRFHTWDCCVYIYIFFFLFFSFFFLFN